MSARSAARMPSRANARRWCPTARPREVMSADCTSIPPIGSGERSFDRVVEMADAGLERSQRQFVDRSRRQAGLAEGGGAIVLAGEHALVEQGPAALPMVEFL